MPHLCEAATIGSVGGGLVGPAGAARVGAVTGCCLLAGKNLFIVNI